MNNANALSNGKNRADHRSKHAPIAKMPMVIDRDGRKVSLADLPLIAFALRCGHLGREYGITKHDLVFCSTCGRSQKVSRILAG